LSEERFVIISWLVGGPMSGKKKIVDELATEEPLPFTPFEKIPRQGNADDRHQNKECPQAEAWAKPADESRRFHGTRLYYGPSSST
jgi:hypothetical protein